MKIIRLSSIFTLTSTLLFPSSSPEAEDALNHAYTYHWLARYKNSDSWDFLKSKEWFEKGAFEQSEIDLKFHTMVKLLSTFSFV